MGVSVVGVDHEWSQAIDGDWKWLDREHRLAKEAGLQILPWLSLKVWSDLSGQSRMDLMKQWSGGFDAKTTTRFHEWLRKTHL